MNKNLSRFFVWLYLVSTLIFSIYTAIEVKKSLDDISLSAGTTIYRIACDPNVSGVTKVKHTSHHRMWSEEYTSTFTLYAGEIKIGTVTDVYTEDKDGNILILQTSCNP